MLLYETEGKRGLIVTKKADGIGDIRQNVFKKIRKEVKKASDYFKRVESISIGVSFNKKDESLAEFKSTIMIVVLRGLEAG